MGRYQSLQGCTYEETIVGLQENLHYRFKSIPLLFEALTHASFSYEHQEQLLPFNERLEFVGDAVLDLIIAEELFRDPATLQEGRMSKLRAVLVCEETLASLAEELGLGYALRLGHGENLSGGRGKASNLANAMEAVLAAIYFDSDLETTRSLVRELLAPYLEKALQGRLSRDYKSGLIEYCQSQGNGSCVNFSIIAEEGPVHRRSFTALAALNNGLQAEGKGKSKKQAEQEAAKRLWSML